MSRKDNAIAGTHLGQKSDYAEQYDPSLLVAVPRQPNRDNIGIKSDNLPWKYSYDVWNCYEISSLLSNGQPFSGIGKLVYSGNSDCIVESKSLKLYLNSFNQTRQNTDNIINAYRELVLVIERDLSQLLKTPVHFSITSGAHCDTSIMTLRDYYLIDNGHSLIDFPNIDTVSTGDLTKYTEDVSALVVTYKEPSPVAICIHTANLFSRCQITNQPDHGDLFVVYRANDYVSNESLNTYIASLRGHSCFHEPTVETIYTHLWNLLSPEMLMVGALYTRRGGISIAPFRSSHGSIIPYNLINHRVPHTKLPRE